jgi:signal transduction histidine kinase
LAIVKGFVEAQGGTITVQNKLSGGATFTIRLPQSESPPSLEALA